MTTPPDDGFDDGYLPARKNDLSRLNIKQIPKRQTAVALSQGGDRKKTPVITAAGRGKIAEKILALAFENDIKVREDGALAEMLAKVELDSPIPSEAFMAVAEILSYVYRANNTPNPFDAVLEREDDMLSLSDDAGD